MYIIENRWISIEWFTIRWFGTFQDGTRVATLSERSRLAFPRSKSIEAANWRVTSRENRRVGFRRVPASTRGIRLRHLHTTHADSRFDATLARLYERGRARASIVPHRAVVQPWILVYFTVWSMLHIWNRKYISHTIVQSVFHGEFIQMNYLKIN